MNQYKIVVISVFVTFAMACQNTPRTCQSSSSLQSRIQQLEQQVPVLLDSYKAAGAGIAIIEDEHIAWSGYFGKQGPSLPVAPTTVFNTASVAKTLTAETLLALAAKGLISLDETIHVYVDEPGLSTDPRFQLLTTRMLLSHRGGLRNWPYEYDDGVAEFDTDPGTTFRYSGMGIELAAQYAENKLGADFETLAIEHVLAPLGVTQMSMGRIQDWMTNRLATPMNSDGAFFDIATSDGRMADAYSDGRWSGADDLLTTVDAYATFLIGVMRDDWLAEEWRTVRGDISSSLVGDDIWDCTGTSDMSCADEYGFSFGWMVYRYANSTVYQHGGNDSGENSLVVYDPVSGNGSVIFVNGGNGIFVSTQILGLIGQTPDLAGYYRALVNRFYDVSLSNPKNTQVCTQ